MAFRGMSNKDIANALNIGEGMVERHLANIYDKLQVCNRVQAFRRVVRLGILDDLME